MDSKKFNYEFRTLVHLEVQMQLLDTEGLNIDIRKEPPAIPDDPDNYIFGYNP
jgi:hypothetical protein